MSDAPAMIPVGYMLKHAEPRPDWIGAPQVREIASVSHCIAKPFAEYVEYWLHNGMWLFDSPQVIFDLMAREGLPLPADSRLYYYEAYPLELEWDGLALPPEGWRPYAIDEWAPTAPIAPAVKRLLGYDVIAYLDMIDCSPLSCHAMADKLPANAYCLFDAFETAKAAIEDERFKGCHEGKYRIFAVYAVEA